jgi:glycosyltransferase involved in cell wall biosynthesis
VGKEQAMSDLNVLLVCYVFPPAGGTGVMRAASLARYLPLEGIRLDVLTTRNASAVGADPSLLKEIPGDVRIHRTITLDLPFGIKKGIKKLLMGGRPAPGATSPANTTAGQARKSGIVKRALENILVPDPQVTWYPVLTRTARRIVKERKIDLVLITAPPFSNLLLVERLRKEFPRLPIVVDFRDEWLTTAFELVSFLFSRTEHARRTAARIEAAAVTNATAVVAVTEAARRKICSRYPSLPESKFHLIPNGFDSTKLRQSAPAPRSGDKIAVTHVGTIYTSTEPTALVEAVESLPPELRSRFLFRFIGHIEEPRFRDAILRLGENVELHGYLPQRDALALMDESDYVLLINQDPLNVGGKFYDYVGGGKPILGAVHPQGETRRLLEELRAGWWAPVDDVAAIRQLFLDAANRGKAPFAGFKPDNARIAQYERKALAQRYAALLHSVADSARQAQEEEKETTAGRGQP